MSIKIGIGRVAIGLGTSESVYESESTALFARMTALSETPTSARKTIINTAIAALKTQSIWSKLDTLWMTAAHGNASARLNWIEDASNLTNGVAPTFTTDRGFQGNGSSMYLKTSYTPSGTTKKLQRDTATIGVYTLTDSAEINLLFGAQDFCMGWLKYDAGGTWYPGITGSYVTAAGAPGNGMFTLIRDSSTTVKMYANKVRSDFSNNSVDFSNHELYLLAYNSGGPNLYSGKQISFAFGGSKLTPTEQGLIYDILVTGYLTSIGAI